MSTDTTTTTDAITRDEVCVVAVAECFRGDGELLCNPIGLIPMIGGRLARETFEPYLVMTDGFADEKGNAVRATHYGMGEDIPLEMLVTVTFEDVGTKTKMTLRHEGLPAGEMREDAGGGWNESFDKLAEVLEN